MSAELAPKLEQKPELRDFNLWVDLQGRKVPVIQAPELATLFPKRSATAFDALKLSILANGQEGRCLYCSLDGETLLCVDGHDTSKAFAELRKEGRPVEIAWDLYEPKATSREKILLELMAIVIRRKILQTAVVIEEGVKELAIRQYLVNCYSQGLFPSDRWVAEDVGCSDTWVGKIRRRAVKAGFLMEVVEYDTRNGRKRSATTKREVFAETETIPIGIGLPAKLESEITEEDLEREKRAREEAAKLADEIIKEANERDNKPLEAPAEAAQVEADEAEAEAEQLEAPWPEIPEEIEQDAARFAEEMVVLNRWNSQRPKPFTPAQLNFLWGADLVDIDSEDVRLFLDREKLETHLCDLLAPILEDAGVSQDKLKRSLHNLLKTK